MIKVFITPHKSSSVPKDKRTRLDPNPFKTVMSQYGNVLFINRVINFILYELYKIKQLFK